MPFDRQSTLDALSALVPLGVCLAIAASATPPVSVPAVVVGAVGAVAVELALERRRAAVRRRWERRGVRAAATALAVLALGVALAGRAWFVLWLAVGGLVAYLLVLSLSLAGVVTLGSDR